MHCPIRTGEGTELFLEYGARSLTPEKEVALERHMASCEDCQRVASAQRTVWNALDVWEPSFVSPDFDQRLYSRIAREEQLPWYRRWFDSSFLNMNWALRPAMPVGAACVAVLAAFLFRGPVLDTKPDVSVQPQHFDMEQVERALDDVDMLKQLGVVPSVSNQNRHSESM